MFPTNPYYEISSIAAPAVAGGAAATIAPSTTPATYVITAPTGALYDTATSPLVVQPNTSGMHFLVQNSQATALKVTTGASFDPGFVLAPGTVGYFTAVAGVLIYLGGTGGGAGAGAPFTARAVVTAALPAYTRVGGTITAQAVGAPGAVFDGVTPVAGDVVLLPAGIAVAPSDAGPYIITQMGTAGLALIMTRPLWWIDGGFVPEASQITVQEGTVYKASKWTTWVTTSTTVIGTSDPLLYPDEVTQYFADLNGTGTRTVSNVPIRSTQLTEVRVGRKAGAGAGLANTVGYWPTVANANGVTAGPLGTGQVVIQAVIAAGTINATDNSAVTVTIKNK